MKDYLFVFRNDFTSAPSGSPEEMQAMTQKWMDWIGSIAAKNKLTDRGNALSSVGKVLRPDNTITNGPYTEIKELIGGYTLVNAESIDEATELAKGCPILSLGGNVEVREIRVM